MNGRTYELAEPERSLVRRLIDAALIAFREGENPNNLTPLEAAQLVEIRLKFHPLPELASSGDTDLLLLLSEQFSLMTSILLDGLDVAELTEHAKKADKLTERRNERGSNATRT